jgi:hypothetical protein
LLIDWFKSHNNWMLCLQGPRNWVFRIV